MSGMPEHGPRWADIGVNLGDKQFAEDSEQVLARAAERRNSERLPIEFRPAVTSIMRP